jgi:hypothetical protein
VETDGKLRLKENAPPNVSAVGKVVVAELVSPESRAGDCPAAAVEAAEAANGAEEVAAMEADQGNDADDEVSANELLKEPTCAAVGADANESTEAEEAASEDEV